MSQGTTPSRQTTRGVALDHHQAKKMPAPLRCPNAAAHYCRCHVTSAAARIRRCSSPISSPFAIIEESIAKEMSGESLSPRPSRRLYCMYLGTEIATKFVGTLTAAMPWPPWHAFLRFNVHVALQLSHSAHSSAESRDERPPYGTDDQIATGGRYARYLPVHVA